ncbi:MAG: hypothetical protein M1831_002204 [Alyxoria varia]|nr:MAG: hypothetical protein M1831_002204 [Alyxoria varia]
MGGIVDARYVALKIAKASRDTVEIETSLYDEVSKMQREVESSIGSGNVMSLIDRFKLNGPNGIHQCLVFEVMGPSASSVMEDFQYSSPVLEDSEEQEQRSPIPLKLAKSIIKQLLQGLAFLHEHGICHGDVQPGNLLISLNDLESYSEDALSKDEEESVVPENDDDSDFLAANAAAAPVVRIDGKSDPWAPRLLRINQPLDKYVKVSERSVFKISDFGAGFKISEPRKDIVTPLSLRAPETILQCAVDHRIDIWSFGCLLFQLLTNAPLFSIFTFGIEPPEQADDDHLAQLHCILGRLPDWMLSKWPRYTRYLDPSSLKVIRRDVEESEVPGCEPFEEPPMEETFLKLRSADIEDEEAQKILALLRRILKFDPAQRPEAVELLRDGWIAEIHSPV